MSEKLSDYDFDLPEELIALRPANPRVDARMLVAQNGRFIDAQVRDLCSYLRPGDLLVFNDTKVIPARLRGTRTKQGAHGEGVARIEVTLINVSHDGNWRALCRPAKRLAVGDLIEFSPEFNACVLDKNAGEIELSFNLEGADLDGALERYGEIPLPPYIASKRKVDAHDKTDYQTCFAKNSGAVAAPTASLHFQDELLDNLKSKGVQSTFVTLHVGAGTFLPVKTDDISNHKMHAEWGNVSPDAAAVIMDAKKSGGRVIPVGTTALRLIETAATSEGIIAPWRGDTDIFIRPGYKFQITDGLMTNFHLPKSTLMMLVSALMGKQAIRDIYTHAIAQNYRFFSYGDSSLLLPMSENDSNLS